MSKSIQSIALAIGVLAALVPFTSKASDKFSSESASISASSASASVATTATAPRRRKQVIAELRAARAAGELNFWEQEIGWPVVAPKAPPVKR